MNLIKPVDVFIFGDGKPFNAGEHHFRDVNFFINPIPFVSALNSQEFKQNVGFISIFDLGKEKPIFKVPFDVGFSKTEEKVVKSYLKKAENQFISNKKFEFYIKFETSEKIETSTKYFYVEDLANYLLNSDFKVISGNFLFTEQRAGIEIQRNTRTTKEKKLYFQPFYRLKENIGFLVQISKNNSKKFITLGGEAKVASISEKDFNFLTELENKKEEIKQKILKTGYFKIVLLTPTNSVPELNGAKLIAKVIGKPIIYSSWINWLGEKGFPSRVFRFIPEGSVFYYRLDEKNKLDEIFNKYWLIPSFYEHELPFFDKNNPIGFGLSIIGVAEIKE